MSNSNNDGPLSFDYILGGIIVTVLGGLILAWILNINISNDVASNEEFSGFQSPTQTSSLVGEHNAPTSVPTVTTYKSISVKSLSSITRLINISNVNDLSYLITFGVYSPPRDMWHWDVDLGTGFAVFSPSEQYIISSWDRISVYSTSSLISDPVISMYGTHYALSPLEDLIAVASESSGTQVWRLKDGLHISNSTDSGRYFHEPMLYSNGEFIVTVSPRTFGIQRTANGELVRTVDVYQEVGLPATTFATLCGDLLALDPYSNIEIWHIPTNTNARLTAVPGEIVTFSPDCKYLLITHSEPNFKTEIWQVSNGTLIANVDGTIFHESNDVFSSSNERFLTATHNRVMAWQMETGQQISFSEGYSEGINDIAISPDGSLMATIEKDNILRLWQASDGTLLKIINVAEANELYNVQISSSGRFIIMGADTGIFILGIVS